MLRASLRRMSVRKSMARGVQGATNLTHNQLGQHILKLAQEQERLHGSDNSRAKRKAKTRHKGGMAAPVAAQDVTMAV